MKRILLLSSKSRPGIRYNKVKEFLDFPPMVAYKKYRYWKWLACSS